MKLRRLFARHQGRVIEHRLDLDETAQFARIGACSLEQAAPGEEHRPAGEHTVQGVAKDRHRSVEIIERSRSAPEPPG